MKRNVFCWILVVCVCVLSKPAYAGNEVDPNPVLKTDTVNSHFLNEVVVTSSSKETNKLKKLPGSVSVISPLQIEGMQIGDVVDISTLVPNFYIPDYGSKMTSPVYIRGIGNRSTGQATGLYVDNVPMLNKSTYDFDFIDVQRIELLRGPQGTLYGRNAMGGILNVYTPSSLDYQRTKIGITGGNYGLFRAKASNHTKLNDKFGFSVGGYYDRNDGYFTNQYTGKKADELQAGGGNIRLDYQISPSFKSSLIFDYDYSDQGAFPYSVYDKKSGEISPVNYNDEGSYLRKMGFSALNLEYKNDRILLSSTTSYQGLNDDMNMDQDYTALNIYNIQQKQKQYAVTEEINLKSNAKNNYQWSFGVFGFYNSLKTDVNVDLKKFGIQGMIQPQLNKAHTDYGTPQMTTLDTLISIPGAFETPVTGGAIFHQSTYNNLFIEGLSITAGIRLDYENDNLDYNTSMGMNVRVQPNRVGVPPFNMKADSTMKGSESMDFIEIMPKAALKYEFDSKNYVYFSVAKGYNPGGYNIQALSDLLMQSLFGKYNPNYKPVNVDDAVSYDPEYSWNYELGYKGEIIRNILTTEVALFYIDIDDMHLTKFVNSGAGRMITNAGNAVSKGGDLTLNARIIPELSIGANYGFTHATFKNYDNGKVDYSGKYLPYVPKHTFSFYGSYIKQLNYSWIDRFNLQAQYNGIADICWNEANDVSQDFYGLLNVKAGMTKGLFSLNLWAKNLLDKNYNTFYFESMGKSFVQQGKPFTFGADLIVMF